MKSNVTIILRYPEPRDYFGLELKPGRHTYEADDVEQAQKEAERWCAKANLEEPEIITEGIVEILSAEDVERERAAAQRLAAEQAEKAEKAQPVKTEAPKPEKAPPAED